MYEYTDGKHVVVEKVTIEREPGEVFAFITNPRNIPLFWSNISDYELLSDAHEKGARAKATFKIAGRKMHWTAELVEVEADELLSWRSVEAPFPFQYEYRFEPMGDGTAVTYWIEAEDIAGFFGKIAEKIVGRMMSRDVHGALMHLKDLLEGETD